MSLAFHHDPHWSTRAGIPFPGAGLPAHRQFMASLPRQGESAQQTLETALVLLAVAEEYIDDYTRAHHTETTDSPTEQADTDESVAWMHSSLNDIAATLIGIATHPAT